MMASAVAVEEGKGYVRRARVEKCRQSIYTFGVPFRLSRSLIHSRHVSLGVCLTLAVVTPLIFSACSRLPSSTPSVARYLPQLRARLLSTTLMTSLRFAAKFVASSLRPSLTLNLDSNYRVGGYKGLRK